MSDQYVMGQIADPAAYGDEPRARITVNPLPQEQPPAPLWPEPAAPPEQSPHEIAARRMQHQYRRLPPAGNSNMEAVADALVPQEPWEYGLMVAAPGAGLVGRAFAALPRVAKMGALAAGFGLTSGEAQAGKGGAAAKLFTRAGDPVKGGAYTKQSRAVLDEIAAGPKGAGPMDLTGDLRSDVPQVAMERFAPPRGVSPRLQDALANADVQRGVRESIERGIGMGADKWYHNEPVRQAFIKTLGPVQGPKDYAAYMDMVAATSPRSDVPTNIRNASFYYSQGGDKLPKNLPYPYGHVAQNLHRQNYETLSAPRASALSADAPTATAWDIFKNPKPASFSQNLQGNLEPGTMDTHAFRNIGMRTNDPRFLETSVSAKYKQGSDPGKDTIVNRYGERKGDTVTFRPQKLHESGKLKLDDALDIPYFWTAKPNANEYAAAEQFYRNVGRDFKLPTADAQAAAWSGGGELTGLGTVATHTFPQLLNERILYTAKMRSEDPQKTLADFISRKAPLLGVGGATMGGVAAQDDYRQ